MLSFTQSLLEPGSAGATGEAQHADSGLQQLHVSCQVSLHVERHHGVHKQEQDQQPARVRGGGQAKVSQHQVSLFFFFISVEELEFVHPGIICSCIPLLNCRILSMMNNEAAPSYFNGGSLTQYMDYR